MRQHTCRGPHQKFRKSSTASRQHDESVESRSQRVAKMTSQPNIEHGDSPKRRAKPKVEHSESPKRRSSGKSSTASRQKLNKRFKADELNRLGVSTRPPRIDNAIRVGPSGQAMDRTNNRAIERPSDGATERSSDRAPERPRDRAPDGPSDLATDHASDRTNDQPSDRATERPSDPSSLLSLPLAIRVGHRESQHRFKSADVNRRIDSTRPP